MSVEFGNLPWMVGAPAPEDVLLLRDASANVGERDKRTTIAALLAAPYAVFDGEDGNWVVTPSVNLPYSDSSIDVRARISGWSGNDARAIISHRIAANDTWFTFRLEADNRLAVSRHNAVLWVTGMTSNVDLPSETEYVRAVSWTAGSGPYSYSTTYYTSADGQTWTQLGTTRTQGGVADDMPSPYAGEINIGANRSLGRESWQGNIHWAEIRDGEDGAVLARFDASEAAKSAGAWWGDDGLAWVPQGSVTFEGVQRPGFRGVWGSSPSSASGIPGALALGVVTRTMTADRMFFVPFEVPDPGIRIKFSEIDVQSANGTILRAAIARASNSSLPMGDPIWQATFPTGTTGAKTISGDLAFLPPGRYVAMAVADGAPQLRNVDIGSPFIRGAGFDTITNSWWLDGVGVAELSDPLPQPISIANGSGQPFRTPIWFRWDAL